MDELEKLEHLSLVSKICTELDNHLGLNDKDLGKQNVYNFLLVFNSFSITAEFIIDLAEKNPSLPTFKKVLLENGAEFSDSFMSNLLRIIQLMKPPKITGNESFEDGTSFQTDDKTELLAIKFPGLALPNDLQTSTESDETKKEDKKGVKDEKPLSEMIVDDMFAELEALAPSKKQDEDDDFKEKERKIRSTHKEKDKNRRSRSKDRSRRHRSSSRDRSRRHRSSSRDRKHSRRGSRSRDRRRRTRSRSPEHKRRNRSRSRSRYRDSRPDTRRKEQEFKDDPEPGKIYSGKVANIVAFGAFVQIFGLRKRWEGLVHISQLRSEGRVSNVSDVVSKGDNVKVKCISLTGNKVSLSMKEVDQLSGEDLNPMSHAHLQEQTELASRNPDRPMGGTEMLQLQGNMDDDETTVRKKVTRISSPERWEIQQMISSGVIDRTEMPDFDEENGLLPKDDEDEEDIEIEIVEDEPPFLQGHGRALHDLSPVRIMKNPDGSLAQAAMMQSALAKERREQKMLQREQEQESLPTGLNKNWIDPLPDGMLNLSFNVKKN